MTMFMRTKRVTDPLNDRVKARLRGDDVHWIAGYATSGSEHEAHDPSCLSGLIQAFFESDDTATVPAFATIIDDKDGDVAESGNDDGDSSIHAVEMMQDLICPKGDTFRLRLLSDASTMAEAFEGMRSSGSRYRRAMMGRLREVGYNAGICKARWDSCGGLTAGSYEYIDVVVADGVDKAGRYIVDLDFAAQFEVARSTQEYEKVLATLPTVMVGRPEEVRQVVRVATQAGRRSLRIRGLSVPPWRKVRYMLAKWLGPYRRTVNILPSSAGTLGTEGGDVKSRAVGFRPAKGAVVPDVAWTKQASGINSNFGVCRKEPMLGN